MKNIKILVLALASSMGAMAADLDVTPGQLEALLGDATKNQTELTLHGRIDARDLAALENLPSGIETLDLSDVSISGLTMPNRKYFGKTLFQQGEIPAYTFFKFNVKNIVLPRDVATLGQGAFSGSDITSIVVPEGVTEIGDYAFYGCPGLKTVTLPSTLKTIGKGAFGNCPTLETVDLSGTSVTSLPERVFSGDGALTEVKLPSTLTAVGREAFSHTGVKALNLNKVTDFDAYALSSMQALQELTLNPNANISDGLLMDDISLASLSGMPDYVPDYFAANCTELPSESLGCAMTLGRYSFANTKAPEVLYLTSSLSSIDRGALSGLDGITKIDATELGNNVPVVDDTTFEGIDQEAIVLWVDDAAFDAWESHPVWRLFQVMSTNQTGVDEIEAEVAGADIKISTNGGMLVVESPARIADLRIYTTDGRMAYVASPDRETVEIETASLPSGVVVVAATDGEGNAKTVSLLLK